MTDRELDERIARALGWVLCEHIQEYRPWDGARDCDFIPVRDFSPATSVDALRRWVLPEIKARGLDVDFMMKMHDVMMSSEEPLSWACLTASPSTLAAAALEVLEASNA